MQHKIYFISGVCGVGKTSAVKCLKKMVSTDKYDIHDFDERGVPDGGGPVWHDAETRFWLETAATNAKEGKDTIISGFANPDQFKKVYRSGTDIPAQLILLTSSDETLRTRLQNRHSTPATIKEINRASGVSLDTFIEDNVSFTPTLRTIFKNNHFPIIDTNGKSPEEVAREIIQIVSL